MSDHYFNFFGERRHPTPPPNTLSMNDTFISKANLSSGHCKYCGGKHETPSDTVKSKRGWDYRRLRRWPDDFLKCMAQYIKASGGK